MLNMLSSENKDFSIIFIFITFIIEWYQRRDSKFDCGTPLRFFFFFFLFSDIYEFNFKCNPWATVPCGGRKTSPRTSTIVQFIFYFCSFEISVNILRNPK